MVFSPPSTVTTMLLTATLPMFWKVKPRLKVLPTATDPSP